MDTQETPKTPLEIQREAVSKALRDVYYKETGKLLPTHLEARALMAAGLLGKPEWM